MPRVRAELSAARRTAILRELLLDTKPVKAIAADHAISLSWCRNVMWGAGYRAMLVSPTERASILAQREAATAPRRVAA